MGRKGHAGHRPPVDPLPGPDPLFDAVFAFGDQIQHITARRGASRPAGPSADGRRDVEHDEALAVPALTDHPGERAAPEQPFDQRHAIGHGVERLRGQQGGFHLGQPFVEPGEGLSLDPALGFLPDSQSPDLTVDGGLIGAELGGLRLSHGDAAR
jgi:hypothetical protein